MYSNWEEWLGDPSRPPQVKAEFANFCRGRPRKEAKPSLLTIMALEDEEEELNNRVEKPMEVHQIDSNPDISSLIDQDVKQQAAVDRPGAEGSSSLLGKRDRPEPVADVEVIRAQPEVESGIQILASDPPGVAQIEDQKKSNRIKKVEVEEADTTFPNKGVRRKLKKLAKEQVPAKGESKVLQALAQPDLRVQKY